MSICISYIGKKLWAACIGCFFSLVVCSQPTYEQLTINNGLPGNSINDVMQDSKGFIWIATAAGFARYDAHRFKTFRYEMGNTNSIKGNFIKKLQEAKDGNIWVCQHAGLSKLNTSNWQVQNYFFADSVNGKKYDWEVLQVYEGKEKTLVASSRGLRELDIKSNLLLPFSGFPLSDSINTKGASRIVEWDANTLLIATWHGLVIMDTRNNSYQGYTLPIHREPGWETPYIATNILIDENKNIWVGWWGGALTRFDINTKKFENFTPTVDGKKLQWLICADIKPSAQKNKLYVTDRYQNAYLFDTKTFGWQNISPPKLKGTNATYHGVLEDKNGIFWMGTSDGLFKSDPRKTIFNSYFLNLAKTPGADNGVGYINRDEVNHDILWLSTYNSGSIYKYDLAAKKILPLPTPLLKLQNKTWEIYRGFCRDGNGNLLISSNQGIYVFNESMQELQLMPSQWGNEYGILSEYNQIFKTKSGKIFIGGYYGLQEFNEQSKKFIPVLQPAGVSNDVADLCEDNQGNIWVALVETKNKPAAIIRFNPQTKDYQSFKSPVLANCVYGTGRALRSLQVINNNRVFIGTSFGFFVGKIEKDSLLLTQAKTNNGFFAEDLQNVEAENDSIIWVRSTDGLYRYHTVQQSFSRFSEHNGMLNNFPNALSAYNNAEVFVGYQDGNFQTVKTAFFQHLKPPTVLITGCKIYNQEYLPNGKDIGLTQDVDISYQQNNIRFDFTALDYTNPEFQLFKYILEGYDKEWTTTREPFALYNNLDGGYYTFKVKACNSYGIWNDKGVALKIFVKPPYWKTGWFLVLCIGVGLVAMGILYKRRIKQIRKEAGLKQQRTEAEMTALRSQMNPHFIFNCLNTIDGFIVTNKPDEASELLQKFSRLIRKVLDNSAHMLIPISQEIDMLRLYVELEKEVMENKFNYVFEIDDKILINSCKIPTLLLQPFIENAILHGLRHKSGKDGQLYFSLQWMNNAIVAIIEDNGIGREAAAAINKKRQSPDNSLGIKLARQRLEQVSSIAFDKSVTITDLFNDGSPAGTRVALHIPILN